MLVQNFLENSAKRLPDKTALICGSDRYTYSELDKKANQLANAMRAQGVQRGDRVVIFMPNSVETVLGIFATLKAGGTFVVVNHTTKRDKLIYILNNCRATGMLVNQRSERLVRELPSDVPSLKFSLVTNPKGTSQIADDSPPVFDLYRLIESAPSHQPPNMNIELDLTGLIYTSGSTGDPKGVMSDHSNVDFATGSIIEYIGNVEDDIVINVLPLSFDYGFIPIINGLQVRRYACFREYLRLSGRDP